MRENDKLLYKTLKTLLNERLSETEAQSLKDEGFEVKNPTRKTAVMVALYKKAAAGGAVCWQRGGAPYGRRGQAPALRAPDIS